MSVRRLAEQQPDSFAFTPDNVAWAEREVAKYPPGRQASAVLSLLWRAQEQEGWVSEPAIRAIAQMLDMASIRVLEVATFYTMFHLKPVGTVAHVQVCGTTPCWLRGANDLKDVCHQRIGASDAVSADGRFSWEEVECLGACVNAPMVQIGADTYEDLTTGSFQNLLDDLAAGRRVEPGPQIERQFSAPVGGPTTLTGKATEKAQVVPAGSAATPAAAAAAEASTGPASTDADRPAALDAPRGGKADDLKRIKGIGPKIERLVNDLGVYHYDQIAEWSDATVAWVDEHLSFKGRIAREQWIAQAKTLAKKD
jgi:NADH-quinone oxidoreductase subunit E